MRRVLPMIFGIVACLLLTGLVAYGSPERQAYRAAKGNVEQQVQVSQERVSLAVEMATKAVDVALVMAGNLPSQQAAADLVKQDIEEIGRRLNEAAELQGEAAVASLDLSIEQFNKTLNTVEDASAQAEDPQVKTTLDRIYGVLTSTKEQLVQTVLSNQS